MEKDQFFNKLHNQLAKKYNLNRCMVNSIRSLHALKKTRKEIAEWAAGKIHVYPLKRKCKNGHSRSLEHFQTLLNFIASCTPDAWNDITQKTKFDVH